MKFPEESHARDLHRELVKVFGSASPKTAVALAGAGVHWNCTVTHGDRLCLIHCFDLKGAGPEYLVSFEHEKETCAMGRTSSRADTIAAAQTWIGGCEVSQLQERFAFVDRQKRSLKAIVADVIGLCPELQHITHELKHTICDLYDLCFRARDRSCRIHYWGKNTHADAIFNWDECRIFSVRTGDVDQLALLLKRWLCDYVPPSTLQKEFPSIEMGKVARYYEEGRGIEGEFIESWDGIEEFYEEMRFPSAEAVRALVATMRKKGYDRTLRAGQSMFTLILSRSRRHGLRQGQPSVAFQFQEQGMAVCAENFVAATFAVPEVALTEPVEVLLKKLEAMAID